MIRRILFLLAICLPLAACGLPPPTRSMPPERTPQPDIALSDDGYARTHLTVLTYNVEGLPWPARKNRAKRVKEIGARLAALRASDSPPDVILIQEMFSNTAKTAVANSGYPAITPGPRRLTTAPWATKAPLPGKASILRGEIGLRIMGSGLAIGSKYRIVSSESLPYGRRSCAGIDCLSNKGLQMAWIEIPGVPSPIALYNTHMNARIASRAPEERNAEAHARQALEASQFIHGTHPPTMPIIFGGDFNMRHSEIRWGNFTRYQPMKLVHQV